MQTAEKNGWLPKNFHRAGHEESLLLSPKSDKEASKGWSSRQFTDRETRQADDEKIRQEEFIIAEKN